MEGATYREGGFAKLRALLLPSIRVFFAGEVVARPDLIQNQIRPFTFRAR